MYPMSFAHEGDLTSKWSFGLPDRLAKALDVAGITNTEMAEYLGVSPNTIGNYTSGRTAPKKQTLRLWAMRTGAPLAWIETGAINEESPHPDGPDGGVSSHLRESNPRPIHYMRQSSAVVDLQVAA